MKKLFIKSLMTVGVAGLVGLTSVAMAAEANIYGSIRAGIASSEGETALGAGGGANRIGINATADLGNGMTAGANVEFGVGNFNGDGLTLRRRNVSIGGGWGKLTFGEQNGIYRSAANWDQSYLLGGNIRYNDLDNALGIRYSSNLAGPFSFDVFLVGSDGIERWATAAHYDFGVAAVNVGYSANSEALSYNALAISVNGSAGGFGYYVAYESNKANDALAGDNENTVGVFLSYGFGGSTIYLEQENDISGVKRDATLVGYSHSLGEGVTFIAEYLANPIAEDGAKPLQLALKIDF